LEAKFSTQNSWFAAKYSWNAATSLGVLSNKEGENKSD
jgi:hypothetical protein